MGKEILHQGEVSVSVGTDASRPWEGVEDVLALAELETAASWSHSLVWLFTNLSLLSWVTTGKPNTRVTQEDTF